MIDTRVKHAIFDWAKSPGIYASVDGQYGSTGKGVINHLMGMVLASKIKASLTNAGPNSGHVSIDPLLGPVTLKQLPSFALGQAAVGECPTVILTAGAIINMDRVIEDVKNFGRLELYVHPNAALIQTSEIDEDHTNVKNVASTGQGVGPAMIKKLSRRGFGIVGQHLLYPVTDENSISAPVYRCPHNLALFTNLYWDAETTLWLEASQGFSLGINQQFYPKCTARECTVGQVLSDAGLPPQKLAGALMSVRTYPIRVGNTESSSGDCYADQTEIAWEDLGVEPELTTVTKRVRRVFTFSKQQFMEAVATNMPSAIFLNFCNYLRPEVVKAFVKENILGPYHQVMGDPPELLLLGFGPSASDVRLYDAS